MLIPGFDNAWVALQFHIHAGSDHALDGANFGADMHVVHKEVNSDRLAVLGLFLDPTSPEGGQFADVIPGWKKVKAATLLNCTATNKTSTTTTQSLGNRSRHLGKNGRTLQKSFNPYALIPKGATFYNYQGSLTTPPCTQGVTWNVVDTPVSISVREYDDLINLILDYVNPKTCAPGTVASPSGYTSRPVQPLNNRTITHICPTGTETSQTQKKANTTAKTTTSGGSVPSYKLGLAATLSVVVAGLFW